MTLKILIIQDWLFLGLQLIKQQLYDNNIVMTIRITIIAILLAITVSQPEPVWTDNCVNVTSSGTCAECVQGFYLEYFLCLPCAPLCKCSSQYNYCQSCMSLSYQNSNYSQLAIYQPAALRCILCDTLIPSCLQCVDSQHCMKCYGGLYLVNLTNSTICSQNTCDNNCEICANQLTCQYCKPGSYLDPIVKRCSSAPCSANCLLCSGPTTCATCMSTYRYDTKRNICVSCVPNCLECHDDIQCDVCAPGYYPDVVGCVSSAYSNCAVFYPDAATATACQLCEPGYFVRFGNCNQCVGCQLCALQFLCQTPCQAGATPFNYACLVPFIIFEPWLKLGAMVLILFMLL